MNDQPIRLMRFSDLKAAQVVTSWPQLRRMVDGAGFPPGFLLSPGRRVWDARDVEAWVHLRRERSAQQAAA